MFNDDEHSPLLNAVRNALAENLAATFGRPIEVVLGPPQALTADAVLVIAIEGPPIQFDVEVKNSITPATVAALSARRPRPGLMLFTPRLTPAVIGACRHLGVGCADADGNIFFRSNTSAVDISGRPANASRDLGVIVDKATRLTSRSGVQVIYILLSAPKLRGQSLRTLAAAAGTSLGSVAGVMEELNRQGYVHTTSRGRSLRRTRELLDQWVEGYRLRLYPKLRLGTLLH